MCCVKSHHMFALPTLAMDPRPPLVARLARPAAPRDSRVNQFHHKPPTCSKHLGIGASPYPKRHWRGGYRAWFQGEQFQPARATLRQPPRPKPSWATPKAFLPEFLPSGHRARPYSQALVAQFQLASRIVFAANQP